MAMNVKRSVFQGGNLFYLSRKFISFAFRLPLPLCW